MTDTSPEHDFIARQIVDSAFTVHTTLGPGLLESVYEQCLACELATRNILVERQVRYLWFIEISGLKRASEWTWLSAVSSLWRSRHQKKPSDP